MRQGTKIGLKWGVAVLVGSGLVYTGWLIGRPEKKSAITAEVRAMMNDVAGLEQDPSYLALIKEFENEEQEDGRASPNKIVQYNGLRILLQRDEQGVYATVVGDANQNGIPDYALEANKAIVVNLRLLTGKDDDGLTKIIGEHRQIRGSTLDEVAAKNHKQAPTGNGYIN